jgi:NADP-dependent 3-hydroxy acid dehydrogenase YdfG
MTKPSGIADKNILITGGGSGMGKATAITLAQNGANVAITGRDIQKLESTVNVSKNNIFWKQADVCERTTLDSLFEWFDQEIGKLDILIHAAGFNLAKRSMKDLDEAGWDRLIETNLTGSYNSVRRALERMRPRKKGLIILINSVAGRRSVPLAGIGYNASKFGMSGLGMGIAEEERENGIRITNLYPGEVNTPILEQRITPPSEEHKKRILQADDIAKVILQICELPDRVHIPELVIKPTGQPFV